MFFPVAVTVNLDQMAYTAAEGTMGISVCVSLSELIQRDIVVALRTSNSSSGDSASGINLV